MEEEMVAVFLMTEINSSRFSSRILRILEKDGVDMQVVDCPDLKAAGCQFIQASRL